MTSRYSSNQLLAAAPVALALVRDDRFVFVNEAFAQVVGRSVEAILATEDVFSLVAPETREFVRDRNRARRAGEPVPSSYETVVLAADGERRRIELQPRLLEDRDMLVAARPLAVSSRGLDLLLALGELQARAQRERTVDGLVKVAMRGLDALGAHSILVRVQGDTCRIAAFSATGPFAAAMQPVIDFWQRAGNLPLESLPAVGRAVRDQRTFLLDDVSPLFLTFFEGHLKLPRERVLEEIARVGQHQLVISPVRVHGETQGVVLAAGRDLRSTDLAAVSLFMQQLGSMIEVAENIEALERQNRTLDAIHRVARVRTELGVEQLVTELLRDVVCPATGSDEAAIYLADPSGLWLNLAGTTRPGRFSERYKRIPVARTATGQAVLRSEPRALSVEEWPAASREDVRAEGYRQLAIVPLVVEGRVAGTLNLSRSRDEPYDVEQLRGAELLLAQVALQVERSRLLADARRRVEDLSLVNEVGGQIAQQLQLERVIAVAMGHASRLAGVPNCFLLLLDEDGRYLRLVASSVGGPPRELVLDTAQPSVAAEAVRTRKPTVVTDSSNDPRANPDVARRFGHRTLLAVPLLSDGKPLGALVLGHAEPDQQFAPNDVERTVAVANQLASAIVNARLFESVKQSYRELSLAQAELVKRERLAALGELSAVIAHEVRNPLAVIFNSMAGLRRRANLDAAGAALLGVVTEEAERLDRMVSDLLDFARPHQPRKRPQPLEPILAGALEMGFRMFPASPVKPSLTVAPEVGEVEIDGHLVRQAVVNLVVNALQAMPDGGNLRVEVRPEVHNGVEVARVDVCDDGPGIPAHAAEDVFRPFYTTRATGTGLGLAVVKRIADAHHADVAVASSGGRGATFSLWLPRHALS